MFEPTHGSAPKYAGQNKVNPIAMLLTAKLMLEHIGEKDKAERLEGAVARVIEEGKVRRRHMRICSERRRRTAAAAARISMAAAVA